MSPGKARIGPMVRKNYDETFKRRAVDLFESTPGASANRIASDLGVGASTLWKWIRQYGSGLRTPGIAGAGDPARALETPEQRIARLETELAVERAERRKLETTNDILKAAAKYFAGETNW